MGFRLRVFQFNRFCDCEHELQDSMVSVSLLLIRTTIALSIIKSSLVIIYESSN